MTPSTSVMTAGSFGFRGLEELDDSRQTARDVFGLRRLSRNLREDRARSDLVTIGHHQVGTGRKKVALDLPPFGILDDDRRLTFLVRRFHDDGHGETCDLVHLLVHGDALHDILEVRGPALFCEDGEGIGVPLDESHVLLDLLTVFHLEPSAVDDGIALALPTLVVQDKDLPRPGS